MSSAFMPPLKPMERSLSREINEAPSDNALLLSYVIRPIPPYRGATPDIPSRPNQAHGSRRSHRPPLLRANKLHQHALQSPADIVNSSPKRCELR